MREWVDTMLQWDTTTMMENSSTYYTNSTHVVKPNLEGVVKLWMVLVSLFSTILSMAFTFWYAIPILVPLWSF